jgi:site-specific recombinase XerD
MTFTRQGRATRYFQARLSRGWKQLSTGTARKPLADRIAAMWETLAKEYRAWDVLDAVLSRQIRIGELYDRWTTSHGNLDAIRRDLTDTNLEPFVGEWAAVYAKRRPKSASKTLARVRWLVPEGRALPRSRVSKAWLTERLYAYRDEHNKPVGSNTLRRVHSAWSVFFAYLSDVREAFEVNPMLKVQAPAEERRPVAWYELETVERLVAGQPTVELRGALALAYGGAIERGALLTLRREQVYDASQEIAARGTKAHARNRICKVSAWAWPYVAELVRGKLPTAYLFPDDWRADPDQLTRLHGEAVEAMKLEPRLTLHQARHFWAVTHLRAGVPVAVVQGQLGHSTPMLTLSVYGAFIPTADDRERWERHVEQDQKKRRKITPA